MATRDAVSTIRGFEYQFDYSILQVLKLEREEDTICIEGLEDVDINDNNKITLHQCKCYEGTEYNHSKIKEAIGWMAKHFSENKDSDIKYYIYGVYNSGQHKLPKNISVEFAKKHFFTTKHKYTPDEFLYEELHLDDADINNFIQKLTININAISFEHQSQKVRDELSALLGCKKQEVEPYYCNALMLIRELATNKSITERTISRGQFIQRIKEVDNQFDMWLLRKNGSSRFAQAIKKKYFNNRLNISPYNRFFIIECDKNTPIVDVKTIAQLIANKYSKLTKYAKPRFCPFFCFWGFNDNQLLELKKSLARDGVLFSDGYDFRGADFNPSSVAKEPSKDHLTKLRIIDSIDLVDDVFALSQSTIEIYQFYKNQVFYDNDNYYHVKIPFETITDIAQMV